MTLEQARPLAAEPGAESRVACREFLLVCEAIPASDTVGSWHFCLETSEGETVLDIREKELADPNRLALLAVVRGLEAIEGNGSVTLVSTSRYVIRGLRDSLHRWRENGFVWEQFGRIAPIQNADLWRRVDHALGFHQVNACLLSATQVSGQPPATGGASPAATGAARGGHAAGDAAGPKSSDRLRRWLFAQCHAQQPAPRRRYGPADLALA
jgi:ribonuclease HI